jgi:hypothetical protein
VRRGEQEEECNIIQKEGGKNGGISIGCICSDDRFRCEDVYIYKLPRGHAFIRELEDERIFNRSLYILCVNTCMYINIYMNIYEGVHIYYMYIHVCIFTHMKDCIYIMYKYMYVYIYMTEGNILCNR